MKKSLVIASSVLLFSACSQIPPEAYTNRGDPENLLDLSTEIVNMSLNSPGALARLSDTLAEDPPSRAELSCARGEKLCTEARKVFDKHGVPVQVGGHGNGATLVYERVLARDCENRYIDNSINPYNLNHPTFGCSVRANMVQQVSDKRQFASPNLLDFQDAEKATQTYRNYLKPTTQGQVSGWTLRTAAGGGASTGSFK
jgi:hypothetical protein